MWKNDLTIDVQIDSEYKSQVNFWTQVLTRITDVTLTLASFRGHNEKLYEPNNGNFLSVIKLLASYDTVLRELLDKKSHINYLSPEIQN